MYLSKDSSNAYPSGQSRVDRSRDRSHGMSQFWLLQKFGCTNRCPRWCPTMLRGQPHPTSRLAFHSIASRYRKLRRFHVPLIIIIIIKGKCSASGSVALDDSLGRDDGCTRKLPLVIQSTDRYPSVLIIITAAEWSWHLSQLLGQQVNCSMHRQWLYTGGQRFFSFLETLFFRIFWDFPSLPQPQQVYFIIISFIFYFYFNNNIIITVQTLY